LLNLVAPHTAGDPMTDERWLNCRLRDLQERLAAQGHPVSLPVLSRLLRGADYHLRANRKHLAESPHPDRDRQFHYIRQQRSMHLEALLPVISVDTKKKELVGDFKNAGRIWTQGAEEVLVHDFPSAARGRAVPYGIYDLLRNHGTVYVGQSADTPQFAVDNIYHWCRTQMRLYYPAAQALLIEADSGGSNSARSRVWKAQLQEQLADGLGLRVTVCHYPTGASKWNLIEHRLFSEISKTWAGCPLRTWEGLLSYIEATTTSGGLQVEAHLVTAVYPTGVTVSDEELDSLDLRPHTVCPTWNYTIYPRGYRPCD
jgi:Rhodopirellula transposase DDE domain